MANGIAGYNIVDHASVSQANKPQLQAQPEWLIFQQDKTGQPFFKTTN